MNNNTSDPILDIVNIISNLDLPKDFSFGYEWYQCNIIFKSGSQKYWTRFIAKSDKDAKERINKRLKEMKSIKTKLMSKLLIKRYDIFKVSKSILKNYDFLKEGETDLFYDRVKG